jgi:hypothetical protein
LAVTGGSRVHPACCKTVEYPAATPPVVELFATRTFTPACDTVVEVEVAGWRGVVVVVVTPFRGRLPVGRATTGEWLADCRITTPSTTAATMTAIARPRTM